MAGGGGAAAVARPRDLFRLGNHLRDLQAASLSTTGGAGKGSHTSMLSAWEPQDAPSFRLPTKKTTSGLTLASGSGKGGHAATQKADGSSGNRSGGAAQGGGNHSGRLPSIHSRRSERLAAALAGDCGGAPDGAPCVTLSEDDLRRAGLAVQNLDRIQRMVEFYTAGFHSLVSELLSAAEDPRTLLAKIWTIFASQAEARLKVAFGGDLTVLLRESEATMAELADRVRSASAGRDAAEAMCDMLNAQLRGARDQLLISEEGARASVKDAAEHAAHARELDARLRDESTRRRRAEHEVTEMAGLPIKLSEQSRRIWELTNVYDKVNATLTATEERLQKRDEELAQAKGRLSELEELTATQAGTIDALETSSASAIADAAHAHAAATAAKELEDAARQSADQANALKEQAEADLAVNKAKQESLLETIEAEEAGRAAAEAEVARLTDVLKEKSAEAAQREASLTAKCDDLADRLSELEADHEHLLGLASDERRVRVADGKCGKSMRQLLEDIRPGVQGEPSSKG